MKVILSGYNLDTEVIADLCAKRNDDNSRVTPEVLSAAYARASRDATGLDQLRKEAREEVTKARSSNKNIVFQMGHFSVAEHAVLNFDVMGISRLAVEFLEQHRLLSFTEKSQRYITLQGDFVIPAEFNPQQQEQFRELIKTQNHFYFQVLEPLLELHKRKNPLMTAEKKMRTLEGWAKEDARYMLSLATEAQLGMTANARNLEYVIRNFKYNTLAEVRELGRRFYEEAKTVVPSLIILADKDEFAKTQGSTLEDNFLKDSADDIKKAGKEFMRRIEKDHRSFGREEKGVGEEKLQNLSDKFKPSDFNRQKVRYLESFSTHDPDKRIISALLAKNGFSLEQGERYSFYSFKDYAKTFFKDCLKNLGRYDALPRELELADFVFEAAISASGYAQLKRHRMSTQLVRDYDINLPVTVPESVQEIGKESEFKEIIEKTNEYHTHLKRELSNQGKNYEAANYCLTNAHNRLVVIKMNLRELYHFSRLREDAHAQWDIRNLAKEMSALAKEEAPITTLFLGGKDQFDEVKEKLYNSEK